MGTHERPAASGRLGSSLARRSRPSPLNDGRFHPIAPNAYTGRTCALEDRHGNAFLNVSTHTGIASAAVDWGDNRPSHDCNRGSGPASEPPCPRRDLRDLDYGRLGPEAVSVEYVRADRSRRATHNRT
jgi:hypothetical protein